MSNRMTMNPIGWGATAIFLAGLIAYAARDGVIDICWLTMSLLVGVAVAAIVSHIVYTATAGNDNYANYAVAAALLVSGLLFILFSPGDESGTGSGSPSPNSPGGYVAPGPSYQPGASDQRLRQAQTDFVGEELSENLRITEALNRVVLDSQRMHAGITKGEVDEMLQRVISQQGLLTELEQIINSQNERFRQKLLDAGATSDQANELAISFAGAQRQTSAENTRRLDAWRRLFELTRQSLTLLRDHHDNWRYDDQRGAVIFRDQQIMKRFGPIQDEIQALIDSNR